MILILIVFIFFSGCRSDEKNNADNDLKKQPIKDFKGFIFAGMVNNNAGLYKYDAVKKEYSIFWFNKKEKVVELSYSEERDAAFFLTAKSFGKRGIFPFINKLKLYIINGDSSIYFVKEIGSGLQVFSRWETDNSLRIILNSIDAAIPNYINQQTQIFNTFGKMLLDEKKVFNLTTEGYPLPPQIKINLISPDNPDWIGIIDTSLNIQTSISLFISKEDEKILITKTNQKLNQIEWSDDGHNLFISTLSLTPDNKTLYSKEPETSSLILYSLIEKRILQQWDGGGVKNFFIANDLLIFDKGFDANSSINIFNYEEMRIVDSIKIKGGCGLRNIAQIPDFSI